MVLDFPDLELSLLSDWSRVLVDEDRKIGQGVQHELVQDLWETMK